MKIVKGHSDANLTVLRHCALNLIKAEKKTAKVGWDNDYLLRVIGFN
jgi:hypothetical protein